MPYRAVSHYNSNTMENTTKATEATNVYVRYIVTDVKESADFYTRFLGFKLEMQPPSNGFAMLSLGNLKLLLNKPGAGGGAGQTLSDNSVPAPGGWNRIQIRVSNLEKEIEKLTSSGANFRNEMVNGNGGNQILLQDPSGNLVELFEPK